MKKPFVSLRHEITRSHATTLMHWMEDERVTRYLSDSADVSRVIAEAIDRTQMPILTHLFNRGGRFFMAYGRDDVPVGFVRLIKNRTECEIVLVIGDHDNWGGGIGSSTIREALKLAFLDMRCQTVIARIHPDNTGSLKAFERCGFLLNSETPALRSLVLNVGRYRRLLREGVIAAGGDIYVTEMDQSRLQEMLFIEEGPASVELEHEIERAIVVAPQAVADDVVTMNSKVVLHMGDEKLDLSLVYPHDADDRAYKVSVLSDLGAAILGYKAGDTIDWVIADRTRRIWIDRLTYQPESAGDFHL